MPSDNTQNITTHQGQTIVFCSVFLIATQAVVTTGPDGRKDGGEMQINYGILKLYKICQHQIKVSIITQAYMESKRNYKITLTKYIIDYRSTLNYRVYHMSLCQNIRKRVLRMSSMSRIPRTEKLQLKTSKM